MKGKLQKAIALGVITLPLVLVSGCCCALSPCGRFPNGSERPWWWRSENVVRAEPLRTEERHVDLQGAKTLRARVEIVGALEVHGGSMGAMDGVFCYDAVEWRPEVEYIVRGDQGDLRVSPPDGMQVRLTPSGEVRNEWELRLNGDVPLDLSVALGAGQSTLDMRELNLRDLNLSVGAGQALVNLDREYTHDVHVAITGGVGQLTLRLPHAIGVRVLVNGGLGSVQARGLAQEGNVYTNATYDQAPAQLDIRINGGIGEVVLE